MTITRLGNEAVASTIESQNPHPSVANCATLGWGTRSYLVSGHQAESYLGVVDVVTTRAAADDGVV